MKDLIISKVTNVKEIIKYLTLSSNNCNSAYYYMDDEHTNNPKIRKMNDFEIKERMLYSFEKGPLGWAWHSRKYYIKNVEEMAEQIFNIIQKDY